MDTVSGLERMTLQELHAAEKDYMDVRQRPEGGTEFGLTRVHAEESSDPVPVRERSSRPQRPTAIRSLSEATGMDGVGLYDVIIPSPPKIKDTDDERDRREKNFLKDQIQYLTIAKKLLNKRSKMSNLNKMQELLGKVIVEYYTFFPTSKQDPPIIKTAKDIIGKFDLMKRWGHHSGGTKNKRSRKYRSKKKSKKSKKSRRSKKTKRY